LPTFLESLWKTGWNLSDLGSGYPNFGKDLDNSKAMI